LKDEQGGYLVEYSEGGVYTHQGHAGFRLGWVELTDLINRDWALSFDNYLHLLCQRPTCYLKGTGKKEKEKKKKVGGSENRRSWVPY